MKMRTSDRPSFAWLELFLALALLALLFQLFPSLWASTLWALDVRNWSLAIWLAVEASVLTALIGIRFWPELQESWGGQLKWKAEAKIKAERVHKAQEAKERRLKLEQIKAARSRRIY